MLLVFFLQLLIKKKKNPSHSQQKVNFKLHLSQIPLLFWSAEEFCFQTLGISSWAVISVDLNCLELTQHRNSASWESPCLG